MAQLLYRLGIASARRPFVAIVAWLAALALAVGSFLAFGGTLSSAVSIPNTPTAQLTDRLQREFPDAAKGSGSVVFATQDGQPFTRTQRQEIARLMKEVDGVDVVAETQSPFALQKQLDDARTQVADGKKELSDGEKRLADGKTQIADGKTKLADGKQQIQDNQTTLDEAKKKLDDAAPQITSGKEELDGAKAELDAGKAKLDESKQQLDAGKAKLDESKQQLDAGRARLDQSKQQLDAGQAEIDAKAPELAQGEQQLQSGQAEIDANQAKLDESKQQLDAGKAELDASKQQLDAGQAQLDAAKEQARAQGLPEDQVQQRFAAQQAELDAGRQQYEQGLAQWQAGKAQYDQGAQKLDAGRARLEQSRTQLEQGRSRLESGRAELESGRQQYEQGEAQWQAGKAEYDKGLAKWQAGKAQYDEGLAKWQAGKAQYDEGLAKWQAGKAEYDKGLAQWKDGQQKLDAGRQELATQQDKLAQAEKDLADGEKKVEENRPKLERGERTLALTQDFRAVSEKGDVAMGRVIFGMPTMDLETEQKEEVTSLLTGAEIEGVDVHPDQQLNAAVPQVMGPAEVVGLIVAAIVLVVMLGTLAAAGLPLLNALVGVGVGVTGALAFSGVVEMMSVTPVLGIMLGLAVGIDYALFIVNRHRQQLKAGMPVRESIGLANGTSGNAVVFAGLTVIIALAALNVTGIPFLGMMGTVAAACVAIAVLIAVTLTPALLSLIGARALSRKERARVEAGELQPLHGEKPSRRGGTRRRTMSTGSAVLTALAATVALVLIALPFGSMRLGLPDGGSEPVGSSSERAYTLTGEAFGNGYNGPLVVTADLPKGLDEDQATDLQLEVAEQVSTLDHVRAAVPAALNKDRTLAMIQVIPEDGPNAVSTEQLVQTLRSTEAAGAATHLDVAGVTSGFIDVSAKLSEALPLYLSLVVGLSLVIMVLVFRSLLVPLIATGGFILSVFAAMGAVVAIYQWGWLGSVFGVHAPGPVLSFLPTIMIGVLFGLAMDYQLFIASGMREAYAHGTPAREAVLSGLRAGRSVVIAAAIIMVSVFGGFIFAHDAMIRPIGFGLTVGVLFDAFVVRLLLMPAIMHLLGPAAWWLPRWLDRILPDVDVEGAKLERDHQAPAGDHTVTGELPQVDPAAGR